MTEDADAIAADAVLASVGAFRGRGVDDAALIAAAIVGAEYALSWFPHEERPAEFPEVCRRYVVEELERAVERAPTARHPLAFESPDDEL